MALAALIKLAEAKQGCFQIKTLNSMVFNYILCKSFV